MDVVNPNPGIPRQPGPLGPCLIRGFHTTWGNHLLTQQIPHGQPESLQLLTSFLSSLIPHLDVYTMLAQKLGREQQSLDWLEFVISLLQHHFSVLM